ncbi:MAG TPA: helix-hairpin-helix domain-containing protein [Opitutaceae bacterium]|nr:helix-hairpin-helix domain-containing protein [Opitutaceae bacterium]
MNKSRSDQSTPKPIIVEDALRHLTAGIGQVDGDRAAAYGELSTLRSAKQSSLQRREKIYAIKYGATDRRVLHTQKLQENNTRLRQEIYVAHTQAATPAPRVDANSYVFHGFVRNRERQPLSRLTVALYDEKGAWLRELGYGCTDETGYFILRFARDTTDPKDPKDSTPATDEKKKAAAEEATKRAAEKEAAEKKSAAGGQTAETPAAAARAAKAAEADAVNRLQGAGMRTSSQTGYESRGKGAEIRVYDAKQTLLHRETEPLNPKLGAIDYREIVIDDGGSCVPPPGSTDDPPPRAPAKPAATPRVPAPVASKPAAATPTPPPATEKPATPAPQDRASTPLENIKGVGPKTAAKLRATGIKDVEALKETKTEKLIEFAGTDKKVTEAAKPKATKAKAAAATAKKKKTPSR